jgi:hypothetical protein
MKFGAQALFNSCFVLVYPLRLPTTTNASGKLKKRSSLTRVMGGRRGEHNMNTAGQIAVTLAALIGFGRLFLADEGDSHRLSGVLILAGLVGKIALSI